MTKRVISLLLILSFSFLVSGCTQTTEPEVEKKAENKMSEEKQEVKRTLDGQEDLAKEYKEVIIKTNMGDIEVVLYGDDSPITVNNFLNLAKKWFYDGIIFHRIIKDFMIQGGDPDGTGRGGPGYKFEDEFNDHKLIKGSLAMANAGPNTNGSQFFIVTALDTPHLDGAHTNFGKVTEGIKIVDKIEGVKTDGADKPLEDVVINSIELIKK